MSETVRTAVEGARVEADLAGEGSEAIVCIHGLASRRAALGPLVDVVAEHGSLGLAVDLRGHGTSQGPIGRVSRERVTADLRAWQDFLEDEHGARVKALIGHSLGGLWALATQRPLGADAVGVVASPASILREVNPLEEIGYRIGGLAQGFADRVGFNLKAPYPVSPDETLETPEAIEQAEREDLILGWLPLANVDDLLSVDGPRWARNLGAPALVARPTRDRLVSEESTRALYEALPEPKRWLEVEGPHSCFFDHTGRECAEAVVGELDDLLEAS